LPFLDKHDKVHSYVQTLAGEMSQVKMRTNQLNKHLKNEVLGRQ